jgi:hypothetical protein
LAAGFSLQNALHRLPRLRRRAVHDCTPEAPDAVADTNDNAYVNAMEENNIQSVGGPADLIYDNPGFDAIVLFFRCVSSGSHTFVFSSPT